MSESYRGEDQENPLKVWWNKFGKIALIGLAIAIVLVSGLRFWRQHIENERVAASVLYDQYQQALVKHQKEGMDAAYNKLRTDYAKTPYASAVSLLAASQDVADNEYNKAEAELRWVMDKGHDYAKPLARLRLAQLDMHTKSYDEALSLLADPNAGAYKSAYEELSGDILLQKGDVNAALQHYQTAFELYKAQGFDNVLLQYKLETYAPTAASGG